MTLIKIPEGWRLPDSAATDEHIYRNRRQFLRELGVGAAGMSTLLGGCFLSVDVPESLEQEEANTFEDAGGVFVGDGSGDGTALAPLYPAPRNDQYQVPERELTLESLCTTYNNFYEFSTNKSSVWQLVDRFETNPWTVTVHGLVNSPRVFDFDDLIRLAPLEERIYRFRCVETWAMTVPWTGFPLSALLNAVDPLSSARYVRMVTALAPDQMPGVELLPNYPWPYHEGLTMDEAMNELTLLVTGAYGQPAQRQNGAPVRLIVPWKYGYKSIKSIVEIELVEEQPPTLWSTVNPNEYPFESNVDPDVPHPRWSQAEETLLGSEERIATMKYNGYGDYVAHLYE